MNESTVTVRHLARELNLDRTVVKCWVRNHKPRLGRAEGKGGAARNIVLTQHEAEIVRRELGNRLALPEPEDVARETGQPVYTILQAATELSLDRHTVAGYARDTGVAIQIRNGVAPSFVVTGEGLATIWQAHNDAAERMKIMLRAQSKRAAQIGGRRSQHAALLREDRDYVTGKPLAWMIQPERCEDLSSPIPGGPETCTLQWIPFHPVEKLDENLDLSVWKVSDHREHLSLDRMLADGDQI